MSQVIIVITANDNDYNLDWSGNVDLYQVSAIMVEALSQYKEAHDEANS